MEAFTKIAKNGRLLSEKAMAEKARLICIDPGHGDPDGGAVGPAGTREADVALAVARQLIPELEALGYRVLTTRTGNSCLDRDPMLDAGKRTDIANTAAADCFVSLHVNSSPDPSDCGVAAHSDPCSLPGARLAAEICRALSDSLHLRHRGLHGGDCRDALRNAGMPAALVELAFISNPGEECLLRDEEWRRRAAEAIAEAIDRYFAGASRVQAVTCE